MPAFSMVTRSTLLEHPLFTRIFAVSLFHVPLLLLKKDIQNTIRNSILIYYLYHKLVKFEQNRMMQITQYLNILDKKPCLLC